MKTIAKILLIAIMGFFTLIYAKNPKGLILNKYIHHFGEVEQNKRVSTIFYYTNKTDKVLQIKKVHSTCGCTVPRISKKTLNPGESGEITVTFNTGRYRGTVTKSISFETIPPIQPRPRVIIKATVLPPAIYLEPQRLFISKFTNTTPFIKTIKVLSKKYINFKINNIIYNSNNIKIKIDKYKNTNQKVSGYILSITLFPKKIKENARGNQRFKTFSENIKIQVQVSAEKTIDLNFKITVYIH